MLTVHAVNGSIGLRRAQDAAQNAAAIAGLIPPNIIAVTLLTSISEDILTQELHSTLNVADYTVAMAKLAQQSGLSGIVCSPQEARSLRSVCGEDFLLICPGVRPVGSDQGDQQRTMTPKDAIEAGASYLVIGRPITAAADPAAAFEKIVNDLS